MSWTEQEYLQSEPVKNAFLVALNLDEDDMNIEISLPKENENVKTYNGVDCCYWLKGRSATSSSFFDLVLGYGIGSSRFNANSVCGCAPIFCLM